MLRLWCEPEEAGKVKIQTVLTNLAGLRWSLLAPHILTFWHNKAPSFITEHRRCIVVYLHLIQVPHKVTLPVQGAPSEAWETNLMVLTTEIKKQTNKLTKKHKKTQRKKTQPTTKYIILIFFDPC